MKVNPSWLFASIALFPLLISPPLPAIADGMAVVPNLQLNITTGGDDLREGSVAYAEIRLADGRTLPKANLNSGSSWGNGSGNSVSVSLPEGIKLQDLNNAMLTISQDGAPRRALDGYDNWNLEAIGVTTPRICSGGIAISSSSARVRFTGAKTFVNVPFRVPAAVREATPDSLGLTIATGGDDLREGSVAYAEIRLRDGSTLPKVNLNSGSAWGNGSSNSVSLPLAGKRLGDLASLTLSHDGASRRFPDGYDNWNVDAVGVKTSEVCSSTSLASVSGRPWMRFTGGKTSKSIKLRVR